ncbi:hypothetical protein [Streptomyces sp. SYSU K21746]
MVDVKPLRRVSKPEVAFTFDWTRRAVESRGWQYEVCSEPPPAELENIFLAGYRRSWLFGSDLLDGLRGADLDGVLLGQITSRIPGYAEPQVRSAVHDLLWAHELLVDLDCPLDPSRVCRRSA